MRIAKARDLLRDRNLRVSEVAFAVGYFMFYVGNENLPTFESKFFPIMNGGELGLVLCWIFFFFIFYGPGRWSVDALWDRGRSSASSTQSDVKIAPV